MSTIDTHSAAIHIDEADEILIEVILFDQPRFEVIDHWIPLAKEGARALLYLKGFDYDWHPDQSDGVSRMFIHPKGKLSSVQRPQLTPEAQLDEDCMENHL